MFAKSSQNRFWIFSSQEELKEHKIQSWNTYAKQISNEFTEEQVLSIFEQQKTLDYYACMIQELCSRFQPAPPPSVCGTALMYFKRFYINTSPMEYHPKEVVFLCVYLAAKVDEYNVSISQFIQQLAPDYKRVGEFIIANELLLMQKLHFHLTVHNAFRPLEGFFIDIKTRFTELQNAEQYRTKSEKFIAKALLSDAFLLFAPSQIAIAALRVSIGSMLDNYIISITGNDSNTEKLQSKIREIISIVMKFSLPSKEEMTIISGKLAKCRNQEHNPLSEDYRAQEMLMKSAEEEIKARKTKEKLEEMMEQEDDILI